MSTKNKRQSFDIYLFTAIVLLWSAGTAIIYSTTAESTTLSDVYITQILWICCALLMIIGLGAIPFKYFFQSTYIVYGCSILALLYVIFLGVSAKGAARWISLGFFNIQPSEFAKVGLIFMLARYLSHNTVSLSTMKSLFPPLAIIIVPFLLVLNQPDLGTALVFGAIAIPMLYWSGLSIVEIIYLISPILSVVLAIVPLITAFGTEATLNFTDALPWTIFFLSLCILLCQPCYNQGPYG